MATVHGTPRTNWTCVSVRVGVGLVEELNVDTDWSEYLRVREAIISLIDSYRKMEEEDAWIFVVLRHGEYDQEKFSWTFKDGWQ